MINAANTTKKLTTDRGLTDRAVQALAVIWGMGYEEAHQEIRRRQDAMDEKGDAPDDPAYPRYSARQWKQAHAGRRRRKKSQSTSRN